MIVSGSRCNPRSVQDLVPLEEVAMVLDQETGHPPSRVVAHLAAMLSAVEVVGERDEHDERGAAPIAPIGAISGRRRE